MVVFHLHGQPPVARSLRNNDWARDDPRALKSHPRRASVWALVYLSNEGLGPWGQAGSFLSGLAWRWEDPRRATVSTKHGATQAPCCPHYRHTKKCTAWVHLQSFLDTKLLGSQQGPRAQAGQAAPGRCGYSPGQGLGPGKRLWAPSGSPPQAQGPRSQVALWRHNPHSHAGVGRPKEHPDNSASRTPTQRLGSQSQSWGSGCTEQPRAQPGPLAAMGWGCGDPWRILRAESGWIWARTGELPDRVSA